MGVGGVGWSARGESVGGRGPVRGAVYHPLGGGEQQHELVAQRQGARLGLVQHCLVGCGTAALARLAARGVGGGGQLEAQRPVELQHGGRAAAHLEGLRRAHADAGERLAGVEGRLAAGGDQGLAQLDVAVDERGQLLEVLVVRPGAAALRVAAAGHRDGQLGAHLVRGGGRGMTVSGEWR